MKKSYADIRSEFLHDQLDESTVLKNPYDQFDKWMQETIQAEIPHPTSMILATSGNDGQPSCRVVLLKDVDKDGFVFFTNYLSSKGQQLAENPKAALTFFWAEIERQVRIEGLVEKVAEDISEAYFHSRPEASRLSAAASEQSQVVANRDELELTKQKLTEKYKNKPVPRPHNWGGYVLKPHHIEFWQGRASRLHDRILYTKNPDLRSWTIQRLAP
jgi:pyridoxamine 5'-phosphate oxidase